MKKLGIYFMMLALVAVTFVACGEKEPHPAPVITMPPTITIDCEHLSDFTPVEVTVTSQEDYMKEIKVYVKFGPAEKVLGTYTPETEGSPKKWLMWNHTYNLSDFEMTAEYLETIKDMDVYFCVDVKTDQADNFASRSTRITIISGVNPPPSDTPLDSPVSFTWTKLGYAETVLNPVGLKFKKNYVNKATYAVIEKNPGTAKLVNLGSLGASITTKEGLEKAITDGSDIAELKQISSSGSGSYDIYLGTVVGTTYYMTHITHATVTTPSAGTQVEVTGTWQK